MIIISSTSCGNVLAAGASGDVSALVVEAAPAVSFLNEEDVPGKAAVVEAVQAERKAALTESFDAAKAADPRLVYVVQAGDCLQAVAAHFGVTPDQVSSSYPIPQTGLLPAGQILKIENVLGETTPDVQILPDGEVVYSPSASNFDAQAYAEQAGGFLTTYTEFVPSYRDAEGWDVIAYVSYTFSINPRLLFSLLEYNSNWVFGWPETVNQEEYPLGYINESFPDLHPQVTFASEQISKGYYGWRDGTLTELTFIDGSTLRLAPTLNAGTVGLMQFFSTIYTLEDWLAAVDPETGFAALHTEMFGDPWQRAAEYGPLIPDGLTQPDLILPFEEDVMWVYSSGPHYAWGITGSTAALDFVPQANSTLRCTPVDEYVVAAGGGKIVHLSSGLMFIDMDGDGDPHTGWVNMYLHLDWTGIEGIELGAEVEQGQIIGRPSCLRGRSTGTHVHIARKYNGEWIAAGGPVPFELSGWTVQNGDELYYGTMTRGDDVLISCRCGWKDAQIIREGKESDSGITINP